MCGTCGCGDHELDRRAERSEASSLPRGSAEGDARSIVEVHESLLSGNARRAQHLREHFAEDGVTAINLMGSPGSGKTALLEATAREMGRRWRMAAVSGDLATDRDAERLRAAGLPARSITTGQACHLDAKMVHDALHHAAWPAIDYFFIENVGNLVCPAIYDLGQNANVVALSVTEGEDKPLKYPVMFKRADLVVLTKIDLAPHLDVDLWSLREALDQVMDTPRVIELSSRSGQGMDEWIGYLGALKRAASASPRIAR